MHTLSQNKKPDSLLSCSCLFIISYWLRIRTHVNLWVGWCRLSVVKDLKKKRLVGTETRVNRYHFTPMTFQPQHSQQTYSTFDMYETFVAFLQSVLSIEFAISYIIDLQLTNSLSLSHSLTHSLTYCVYVVLSEHWCVYVRHVQTQTGNCCRVSHCASLADTSGLCVCVCVYAQSGVH